MEEKVNELPKLVQSNIQAMAAQGVPKKVIAEKIKLSAKGTNAEKLVEGVLRKEDPWKADRASRESKKRQNKLKNEIRKQEKVSYKNRNKRNEL